MNRSGGINNCEWKNMYPIIYKNAQIPKWLLRPDNGCFANNYFMTNFNVRCNYRIQRGFFSASLFEEFHQIGYRIRLFSSHPLFHMIQKYQANCLNLALYDALFYNPLTCNKVFSKEKEVSQWLKFLIKKFENHVFSCLI